MTLEERVAAQRALDFLAELARGCRRCPLAHGRTTVVFGEGDPTAVLAVVGEAPGGDEDRSGRPFQGHAGDSLNKALEMADMRRADAYVANVVMCRPPGNRPPTVKEVTACAPYLDLQLAVVRPKVVLALGATAARRLTGDEATLASTHGRPRPLGPTTVVATYHPSPSSLNPRSLQTKPPPRRPRRRTSPVGLGWDARRIHLAAAVTRPELGGSAPPSSGAAAWSRPSSA